MTRNLRTIALGATLFGAGLLAAAPPAFAQDAARAGEYTGPNRMLATTVPRAPNFAGVPYRTTALDTRGDRRYDKVIFHADDFGQFLVAGVRQMPEELVAQMARDEPRRVLGVLSEATLLGWRTEFDAPPEVIRESFLETKHGEAIVRVYRARKGSILLRAQGRRPTPEDAFDTSIASLVARRGGLVVFVLAQNDTSPDDANGVVRMATELFERIRVLAER